MKNLLLSLLASLALTGGAFAQVFPSLFLAQMNGSGGPVRPAPSSGGPASFSSITDTGLAAGRVVYTGTGGLLSANDQFTYDGTSTVAIGSTITNGLQLYNTSDQTTNYERVSFKWSSNVGLILAEKGGSGTLRNLAFNSGVANYALSNAGNVAGDTTAFHSLSVGGTSLTGKTYWSFLDSAGNTATSGTSVGAAIRITYNQASGNAANTDLLINRTQTAVGSGAQNLIDAQAGTVSQFKVGNTGNVTQLGSLTLSQTGGIIGTTTNNSANAGSVGEELKTTVASASAVSLTTATSTNLASVSLTAGDWDVYSEFIYIPGATTSISQLSQGISQSTGALPTTTTGAGDYSVYSIVAAVLGANNISQSVGPVRVSLSGTTTVFAVARPTFTISTLTVYGSIRARRVR